MSKNESIELLAGEILEEQLVVILERYELINWKQAGLEVLIKYTQREKEYWKNLNNTHLMNEMTKIIRMAQALMKTKKFAKK